MAADLPDLLRTALAGLWFWAAISKVVTWPAFPEVLQQHGMLGRATPAAGVAVPLLEFSLGGLLVIAARKSRSLRAGLGVAILLLLIFAVYLLLLPKGAIGRSGCGCLGAYGAGGGVSQSFAVGRAVATAALHGVALFLARKRSRPVRLPT